MHQNTCELPLIPPYVIYKQKNGRTKRKGARKGMTRRDPPQVNTLIIMAPTITVRRERLIMKHPPLTRTKASTVEPSAKMP